jgi:hypothetical protein
LRLFGNISTYQERSPDVFTKKPLHPSRSLNDPTVPQLHFTVYQQKHWACFAAELPKNPEQVQRVKVEFGKQPINIRFGAYLANLHFRKTSTSVGKSPNKECTFWRFAG